MRAKMARFTTIFCAVLFTVQFVYAGYMKITYIRTANGYYGDASFIELPNGKKVLIDGGNGTSSSGLLAQFLDNKIGAGGTIDYMVLSHSHADHYNGLTMALGRYQVNNVYEGGHVPGTQAYTDFSNAVSSEPNCTRYSNSSGTFTVGDYFSGPNTNVGTSWDNNVVVKVLAVNSLTADENARSLVLKISYNQSDFIFAGDATGGTAGATGGTEEYLINNSSPDIQNIDIYKACHHGSNDSSSTSFLDNLSSKYCMIMVGDNDGNIAQGTLDRLISHKMVIYRVDCDYDIKLKCDNAGNYDIVRSTVYVSGSNNPGAAPPPSLPANLVISSHTDTSISLDWNDNAAGENVIGYNVFRSTISGGDSGAGTDIHPGMTESVGIYKKINTNIIETSNFTDTNLTPSTTYYYRVTAVNDKYYERRYSNQTSTATNRSTWSNHVVISQFTTRGLSSAYDEFIELYNPAAEPIDISGWKVQYKSATGASYSTKATVPASTTIQSKKYYLAASSSAYYSNYSTVPADYYMSAYLGLADDGHIRIGNSSLGTGISDSNQVDRVGYGNSADNPEISTAPNHGTSANNQSVERKPGSPDGNGTDIDDNSSDFQVKTTRNPRNSSSPAEPAADTTSPGSITDLTASAGSGAGTINLSWTAVGDDGTNGTAINYILKYSTAGEITDSTWGQATLYSQSWTPQASRTIENKTLTNFMPGKTYWFAVKTQDEVPNTSGISNSPNVVAPGAANHAVISQFTTRGASSAYDEFVELYNPTTSAINISSWKLQYKSATGVSYTTKLTIPASTNIESKKYYLMSSASAYFTTITADLYHASYLNLADEGHVRIVTSADAVIDTVGYGATANSAEGANPAPNHGTSANSKSVERKPGSPNGNAQDTDNNGNDFLVRDTRNPRNSSSGIEGSAILTDSLAEFKEGEIYAYPNPAKGGKDPIIHVECGIADNVKIRFYNIAAELIHSAEISGTGWKMKDNEYSYEYTWDVSNVASGVYIYLVHAAKDDKTIQAVKKVAVIK